MSITLDSSPCATENLLLGGMVSSWLYPSNCRSTPGRHVTQTREQGDHPSNYCCITKWFRQLYHLGIKAAAMMPSSSRTTRLHHSYDHGWARTERIQMGSQDVRGNWQQNSASQPQDLPMATRAAPIHFPDLAAKLSSLLVDAAVKDLSRCQISTSDWPHPARRGSWLGCLSQL